MTTLGADPGLSGALAILDRNLKVALLEDMPTAPRGRGRVKREVDGAALARLLRPHVADIELALVEAPAARPGQGVASMFSLGHSFGTLVGVLQALAVPVKLTTPAQWKRQANAPADKQLARAMAARLWPDVALNRKRDHGLAEALLLARLASREVAK